MKKTQYTLLLLLSILIFGCKSENENLFDLIDNGDMESFKSKIDDTTNINKTNSANYTLLNYSIKRRKSEFALLLINSGANIEILSGDKTPLMYAVKYNQSDVLKLLLAKGADVHKTNSYNKTLVYYAKKYAYKECIKILEENNISLFELGGVDGPYIIYSNNNIESVSVNEKNEIIRKNIDKNNSVTVQLPAPLKAFDIKLKSINNAEPSIYENVSKIFAVSDIEGNIQAFIDLLLKNGVIDQNYNWAFGDGHLVLNGDFVDRGHYVTQVLWLAYKLEVEAEISGGKVHMVIGNHEDMLLRGDWRYAVDKYKSLASILDIEQKELYGNSTELGRWLRSKNLATKINGNIFVHAGISNSLLEKNVTINNINKESIPYTGVSKDVRSKIEFVDFIFSTYGVLWYRGLVTDYKYYAKDTQSTVDEILKHYKADRVIVGHSVVDQISTDYDGKVVRIDVDHHKTPQALLIENDQLYKVNSSGTKTKI